MKTNKLSSGVLALLAIAVSGAMFSCASEESMLVKDTKFYETASKKTFNLQDQTQLNRLASALAKETKAITIVQKLLTSPTARESSRRFRLNIR